jgi:hypothetical protein
VNEPELAPWRNRWQGRTVTVLASGPSLTLADVEKVWGTGPVIVVNTTFRMARWADVLVAYDAKWWKEYRGEVEETFRGEKVAFSPSIPGTQSLRQVPWLWSFRNSGACALGLAVVTRPARILLLGFDCQRTGGKKHWHADHPAGMTNTLSLPTWPKIFTAVARFAKGQKVDVLNCTRETALTCFPRVKLEEALATVPETVPA